MLTRNFYIGLLYSVLNGSQMINNDELRLQNTNGSIRNFESGSSVNISLLSAYVRNNVNDAGLVFGSNNAAESIDDYTISALSFTASAGGVSHTIDTENKKVYVTRRYILNNTSSEKTINEFGVIGYFGSSGANLMLRNVIEPFTIAPNETVNFDLTLEYDFPVDMTFM